MAGLAAGSCLLFLLVVLAMPALKRSGYSAATAPISEGALGRFGWLQSGAFLVLGLGSLLLALVLRDEWSGLGGAAVPVLLAVWGVGVALCGVFPIDAGSLGATTSAKIHLGAAMLSFVCVLLAMWVASFVVRTDDAWASWWPASLVVTVVTSVAFGVMAAAPQTSSWGGYAQRGFVFLVVAWLGVLALQAA